MLQRRRQICTTLAPKLYLTVSILATVHDINSCHEILAQMKSQFQIVKAEAVTFSFCQASGRQAMPTATWRRAKDPRQILESWCILWRFSCQRQPSSRQKFDEICCSGRFGTFMFQIVCNSIGRCGMGTSMRVPMPPRFPASVTKSNRAEQLNRKVRTNTGLGPWWPWASGDSRDMENPCGIPLGFLLPCWKIMNGRQ